MSAIVTLGIDLTTRRWWGQVLAFLRPQPTEQQLSFTIKLGHMLAGLLSRGSAPPHSSSDRIVIVLRPHRRRRLVRFDPAKERIAQHLVVRRARPLPAHELGPVHGKAVG